MHDSGGKRGHRVLATLSLLANGGRGYVFSLSYRFFPTRKVLATLSLLANRGEGVCVFSLLPVLPAWESASNAIIASKPGGRGVHFAPRTEKELRDGSSYFPLKTSMRRVARFGCGLGHRRLASDSRRGPTGVDAWLTEAPVHLANRFMGRGLATRVQIACWFVAGIPGVSQTPACASPRLQAGACASPISASTRFSSAGFGTPSAVAVSSLGINGIRGSMSA